MYVPGECLPAELQAMTEDSKGPVAVWVGSYVSSLGNR